jgi:acetyl-CoA carboxylase biotin carboxyl carrier protein
MDTDLIERLLGLLDRSQVTELEYAAGGRRVRIVKAPAATGSAARRDARAPITGATPAPANAREHRIQAPLSGCFFRASAPGVAPFVAVGDSVAEGDTLALIEAMKLLNPVEADVAGRVVAILPQDGEAIEAGAPLFLIAPAG